MERAPKVVKKNGKFYYKELKSYKYHTKPLTGYKGGYWTWEIDDCGNLKQKWLFQAVELAEWQLEKVFLEMLKHWNLID